MTTKMKNNFVSINRKSIVRSGLNFYTTNTVPAKSYINDSSQQTRLLRLRAFVKNGKI